MEKAFCRERGFAVMIEPSFIGGFGIAFAWKPEPAVFRAVHAVVFRGYSPVFGRPVGLPCPAGFVANPACFSADAPEDAVGAYFVDGVAEVGYIVVSLPVNGAGFVGSAVVSVPSVCAVEPHFKLVCAVCGEFGALAEEYAADVFRGAVVGAVAVPGGDVESVFHAELDGGFCKVARDVGILSVGVAGTGDVVCSGGSGP